MLAIFEARVNDQLFFKEYMDSLRRRAETYSMNTLHGTQINYSFSFYFVHGAFHFHSKSVSLNPLCSDLIMSSNHFSSLVHSLTLSLSLAHFDSLFLTLYQLSLSLPFSLSISLSLHLSPPSGRQWPVPPLRCPQPVCLGPGPLHTRVSYCVREIE